MGKVRALCKAQSIAACPRIPIIRTKKITSAAVLRSASYAIHAIPARGIVAHPEYAHAQFRNVGVIGAHLITFADRHAHYTREQRFVPAPPPIIKLMVQPGKVRMPIIFVISPASPPAYYKCFEPECRACQSVRALLHHPLEKGWALFALDIKPADGGVAKRCHVPDPVVCPWHPDVCRIEELVVHQHILEVGYVGQVHILNAAN